MIMVLILLPVGLAAASPVALLMASAPVLGTRVRVLNRR